MHSLCMYMHMHMCMHMRMHMRMHMYILYMYVRSYMFAKNIYVYVRVYAFLQVFTRMCIYIGRKYLMSLHVRNNISIYIRTYKPTTSTEYYTHPYKQTTRKRSQPRSSEPTTHYQECRNLKCGQFEQARSNQRQAFKTKKPE